MTKPTPRADLVKAVQRAESIVEEGIPLSDWDDASETWKREVIALRAAALPVILRELLDYETEETQ